MGGKAREIGIHELYGSDPQNADWLAFGRQVNPETRRGFLNKTGLAAMTALLGAQIPFAAELPAGIIPAGLANSDAPFAIPGKDGLIILNDRPVNAETPAHLLDDEITPASRLFIRNNGIPPAIENIDPATWTLEIAGESCLVPRTFTIPQLKAMFRTYTYALQLECGGNGRAEFNPPAKGNQWTTGAVGCVKWTGVRVRDVLKACGIGKDAVYIGYYGADLHLSGDPARSAISRGCPMQKALEDESLIAWAMNGEDIPYQNGYPLRLVCAGWPASVSGKWLKKLVVRNKVHDGEKMTGGSYHVPKVPVAPGTKIPDSDLKIIETMPVKSLVTFPKSGISHPLKDKLDVRGSAWAGDRSVKEVLVSIDFGATWQRTKLRKPLNRLAWQRWEAKVEFPQIGYYEVWARAIDSEGVSQPMVVPGWNPHGYLNNACHRVAVQVV